MAGFSELIKNFDKIRNFVRDFFVFGFRGRCDYDTVSPRSYDNERRRIQSYLSDYISENWNGTNKSISISSDTTAKTTNPLFKVWETKSFTKNDLFLHFVIIDILQNKCLSAPQLTEIISKEYTSQINISFYVDVMTVRNKLKEYCALGLLSESRQGRSVCYKLNQNLLQSTQLKDALLFYQNIITGGFLAAPIMRDYESPFIYKQIFFAQTLYDDIAIKILQAISRKCRVTIVQSIRNRSEWTHCVVPLHIRSNMRTGRRYLVCYTTRRKRYLKIRIDYIKSVSIGEMFDDFNEIKRYCEEGYEKSFSLEYQHHDLKKVCMVLNIDEQHESYVLDRLRRESKHGILSKLKKNTFQYKIEVPDTLEMVPWMRTFIGRIISIDGTETGVISQFKRDIKAMMDKYGDIDV